MKYVPMIETAWLAGKYWRETRCITLSRVLFYTLIKHGFLTKLIVMALANEDTLLRKHCCSWCFLGCANWETFVADTKCFWTKSETFFVSPNVARAGKRGNILLATICPQQCVLVCQGLLALIDCKVWKPTKCCQMVVCSTFHVATAPRFPLCEWNSNNYFKPLILNLRGWKPSPFAHLFYPLKSIPVQFKPRPRENLDGRARDWNVN